MIVVMKNKKFVEYKNFFIPFKIFWREENDYITSIWCMYVRVLYESVLTSVLELFPSYKFISDLFTVAAALNIKHLFCRYTGECFLEKDSEDDCTFLFLVHGGALWWRGDIFVRVLLCACLVFWRHAMNFTAPKRSCGERGVVVLRITWELCLSRSPFRVHVKGVRCTAVVFCATFMSLPTRVHGWIPPISSLFCGYVGQFDFDVIPSSRKKNSLIFSHSKYIHMWLYKE